MAQTIAFFDAKPYDREFFDNANRHLGFEIKYFESRLGPETVVLAQGANAVCAFVNDTLSREVLDRLYDFGIRIVALRAAGYNNVDLKAAHSRIHITRVPAYSPHAVAEHTVALILSLNRKIHKAYYRVREGNFTISGLLGFDLNGKTAGIIGTGKIGRIVIQILRGFGMNVLAYDLFPDEKGAQEVGFTYTDLDTLYSQSDIISLHCPLTPQNFYMIDEKSIHKMKPGVMIINTGRGKLINTRALIVGLKTGKVGSAGLDVYEEESEFFFEDYSATVIGDDVFARLLTFPNVLMTSHQGFFTREALTNIAQTTLGNIEGFFKDGSLPNEICYQCTENNCVRKQTGKCF